MKNHVQWLSTEGLEVLNDGRNLEEALGTRNKETLAVLRMSDIFSRRPLFEETANRLGIRLSFPNRIQVWERSSTTCSMYTTVVPRDVIAGQRFAGSDISEELDG
jgi:hypothetical protein